MRARRRCATGSHHRSSTHHGPAQALTDSQGPPSREQLWGDALINPRPLTPTCSPRASITWADLILGHTTAGIGDGTAPGPGSVRRFGPRRQVDHVDGHQPVLLEGARPP